LRMMQRRREPPREALQRPGLHGVRAPHPRASARGVSARLHSGGM